MVKAIADDCGLVMSRDVTLRELEVGMTIDADVMSARGIRLVPRGTEVTLHGARAAQGRRRRRRRQPNPFVFQSKCSISCKVSVMEKSNILAGGR